MASHIGLLRIYVSASCHLCRFPRSFAAYPLRRGRHIGLLLTPYVLTIRLHPSYLLFQITEHAFYLQQRDLNHKLP